MTDHRIELGPGSRVGRKIPAHADHGIAMREPGEAALARHRPAAGMSGLGGISVAIAHRPEAEPGERPCIFGRRASDDPGRQRLLLGRVAPLGDIIVLDPVDRDPGEPTAARERLDIGDMHRREGGRERDDDPLPAVEIDHQQISGGHRYPGAGGRPGDDVRRRRRGGRRCGSGKQRQEEGGGGSGQAFHAVMMPCHTALRNPPPRAREPASSDSAERWPSGRRRSPGK